MLHDHEDVLCCLVHFHFVSFLFFFSFVNNDISNAFDCRYVTAGMACLGLLALYVLIVSILEDTGVSSARSVWPTAVMLPILCLQMVVVVPSFLGADDQAGSGPFTVKSDDAVANTTESDEVDDDNDDTKPLLSGNTAKVCLHCQYESRECPERGGEQKQSCATLL